ncbi:hypothetical protein PPTG_14945 [Phytophthora nicotianae INRA-310]|uniref:Tyr recombinase domain-containing protein n=1 Tax=Phytophthora nicotianae (strain INRA-310) TaxID=761204 RepID=W2PTF5_PHYN3|nr:hypothetical protein PPTG_14945 [Phytophthora nicotianae INRA-310]ETN04243.1 hypothetical protein PPTG_14945 [Phytophthora nicotianae INRA-310]
MTLRSGDYVLLHPEDTPALQGQFQYDEVVSAGRSTVTLRSVGHEREQQYSVGRAVPRKRKVDASEAAGSRVGEWMRKVVWFVHRGYTYYGQVVNYDGYDLLVGTFTGQKRVAVDHLTSEMYPVVAMIMGTRRWSSRVWPLSRLETVHDDLMDCILAGKDGFPVLPADLKEHVPQELSGISDRQILWVDPTSGSTRTDSLSYVLRYIFYADGDAAHPQRGKVLGNSFCDEPSPSQGDNAQDSPRTDFFNPLVDDDDGPVASEPQNSDGPPPQQPGLSTAIGAYPLNTFVPGSRTSAASERPSTDAVGEESQDPELIDLTSRYKPHLLGFYINQYQTSTAGTRKRLREVADAAVETPTASKRSRMAFSPSSEQDRVHLALTAPIHKVEEDLPVLVWWINDGLEKYRNALPGTASGCGTALPADTNKPLDLRPAQEVGEVDTGVPNPSIVQAILETKLQAEERQRDLVISKVLSECGVTIGDGSRCETPPSPDILDSSKQSALSQLVQRVRYSLPELVELVRGQTARDRRPNKALCPKRYDLLLRGYRHQRLLQSIATDGVCPGWLRPEPHQNKRPANHHSANRNLSAEIASIRKRQDASQYLVVNRDVAALWVNVQISPFGAVAKKDVDPSVEARLIHDLSFPVGDSTNDASDKASFPDAHYTNVAAIARRIDECGELHPGVLVCIMKGDVKGAFRHLMLSNPLFPYEWVDDHVLVEADTPGRLSVASAALRLAMMATPVPQDARYLYKTFSLSYRPMHWPNQVTKSMLSHGSNDVDGAPAPMDRMVIRPPPFCPNLATSAGIIGESVATLSVVMRDTDSLSKGCHGCRQRHEGNAPCQPFFSVDSAPTAISSPNTTVFYGGLRSPARTGNDQVIGALDVAWLCPVKAAWALVSHGKSIGLSDDSLLCTISKGQPVPANDMAAAIKRAAVDIGEQASEYGTHSLRSGGATALFAEGVDRLAIKHFGRWSSDCYERYACMDGTTIGTMVKKMVHGAGRHFTSREPRLRQEGTSTPHPGWRR